MSFFNKTKFYAPILVRYSVGIVFFLIGLDQLLKPQLWEAYFPDSLTSFGFSLNTIIQLNAVFDITLGVFLLLGLLARIASLLATLHLIGVIYILGYNDIAIRDFGILLAAFSVFLNGADNWCVDRKIWKTTKT